MNYTKIVSFAGILSAVTCFTSTDVCSTNWRSWGDSIVSLGQEAIVWFVARQPAPQQLFTIEQVPEHYLNQLFTEKDGINATTMYDQFISAKDGLRAIWSCSGKFHVVVKKTADKNGQESLTFLLDSMRSPNLFLDAISNDFACQVVDEGIIHADKKVFVSPYSEPFLFTAMITFPIPQGAEIVQLYDIVANCIKTHSPNYHHPLLDQAPVRLSICLQLCDLYKKVSYANSRQCSTSVRFDPRNILITVIEEDVQVRLLAELAPFFESPDNPSWASVAAPLYIAPECVLTMSGERQKVDMFILAMSIFELATGEKLFSNTCRSDHRRMEELCNGTALQKVRTKWPALAPFLDPDPKKRSCDIERLKRVVATRPFV